MLKKTFLASSLVLVIMTVFGLVWAGLNSISPAAANFGASAGLGTAAIILFYSMFSRPQ